LNKKNGLHAIYSEEEMMKKIMVIDDDPDFVEITRIILESNGYEVTNAYDRNEAMVVMNQDVPDLVLLDIMMDQPLDGVEVYKQMQDKPALKNIPIIVLSCITDSPHADKFPIDEYTPIDDWISKPVQANVLLNKVELYLRRYQNLERVTA
jgi:two-component system, OmpR family, response regulator VicR